MLRLITFVKFKSYVFCPYFKTSYVTVNLCLPISAQCAVNNFKTSYVTVNLVLQTQELSLNGDFKTSYVTVNHLFCLNV